VALRTGGAPFFFARPASGDGQALDPMSLFVAPVLKKALPVLGPALIGLGYGYLLGRLRELRR